MNERSIGKEKRQSEEATFLCEILDDLTSISETIKAHPHTVKELSLSSITIDTLTPPDSLPLAPHTHGEPAELSLSVVATNDYIALETISIEPAESAPLEIVNDNGLARINDGNSVHHRDLTALHDGLLTLVPPAYRSETATVPNLIQYAKERAPQVYEISTFTHEDELLETVTTIQVTELETNTDSLRSIDISIMRPHPSGKHVGTRLILTESLVRRINNQIARDDVERSIHIEAVDDQGLNALLLHDSFLADDTTKLTVPVSPATRHHLSDIYDALALIANS